MSKISGAHSTIPVLDCGPSSRVMILNEVTSCTHNNEPLVAPEGFSGDADILIPEFIKLPSLKPIEGPPGHPSRMRIVLRGDPIDGPRRVRYPHLVDHGIPIAVADSLRLCAADPCHFVHRRVGPRLGQFGPASCQAATDLFSGRRSTRIDADNPCILHPHFSALIGGLRSCLSPRSLDRAKGCCAR